MPLFRPFPEIRPAVRRSSAPTTTAYWLSPTIELVSLDGKRCESRFEGYSLRCGAPDPNRRSSAPEHAPSSPRSVPPLVTAHTGAHTTAAATPPETTSLAENLALQDTRCSPRTPGTASPETPSISELLNTMITTANVWFVVITLHAVPILLDLLFNLLTRPSGTDSTLDAEDMRHDDDDDIDISIAETDNTSPSISPALSPRTSISDLHFDSPKEAATPTDRADRAIDPA